MNHSIRRCGTLIALMTFIAASMCAGPAHGGSADHPPARMIGFTESGSSAERGLEKRFDSLLNPDDLRQWLKHLSAFPHHLGSPRDKENAEYIASVFRSAGLETEIEEFSALFPTPKTRVLEMTSPEPFTASLAEPALPE